MAHIKIIAHRMVLKNYGISPNGHVYFNEHDWCADFSQQSLGTQSWLIHELTHVWQIQQGIKVVRKAIFKLWHRTASANGARLFCPSCAREAM